MFINERIPVKIKIHSVITDLVEERVPESGIYPDSSQFYPLPITEEGQEKEIIDYTVEGYLHLQDSCISILYNESEDMGFEDASTTMFFDRKTPTLLTMVRSGDGATVCRFDPSAGRQMITYQTPGLPLEFAMTTREVRNTVDETGGELAFDYVLEMHGVKTERTEFRMTVTPVGEPEP